MYAMLVKQLMAGAGVNDPKIHAMIDRLMGGGLSNPSISMMQARSIEFAQDAEVVHIQVFGANGQKITLLLASEKAE